MSQPAELSSSRFFRRRRYNLFAFQTRYAAAFIVLSSFITGCVSFLTFAVFNGAEGVDGPMNLKWIIAGIVLLVAGSSVLFYSLVIVASHRIAGPLSLMAQYMREIEVGRSPRIRDLRKGDELKEFYAGFRGMIQSISKRDEEELITLQKLQENLPQQCDPQTKAILSNLISAKSLRAKPEPVDR